MEVYWEVLLLVRRYKDSLSPTSTKLMVSELSFGENDKRLFQEGEGTNPVFGEPQVPVNLIV